MFRRGSFINGSLCIFKLRCKVPSGSELRFISVCVPGRVSNSFSACSLPR